jgi:hypothetical protein
LVFGSSVSIREEDECAINDAKVCILFSPPHFSRTGHHLFSFLLSLSSKLQDLQSIGTIRVIVQACNKGCNTAPNRSDQVLAPVTLPSNKKWHEFSALNTRVVSGKPQHQNGTVFGLFDGGLPPHYHGCGSALVTFHTHDASSPTLHQIVHYDSAEALLLKVSRCESLCGAD